MEQTTEIKAESLQEPRGSEETVNKERNIPLKTDELFKKTLEANLRLIREGKLGSYQLIFSRSDGTYVLPCDIRVDKNGNPYIFIPPLGLAGKEWVYVRKPQHGQHSFLNELVAFSSDNPTVREILNSIEKVTGEEGENFIENAPSLLGKGRFSGIGPYFQLEVDPSGNFWLISEKEISPAAAEKLGRLLGRLKAVGIEISGIKIGFEKEAQRNISEKELKEAIPKIAVSVEESVLPPQTIRILTSAQEEGRVNFTYVSVNNQNQRREFSPYYGFAYLNEVSEGSQLESVRINFFIGKASANHSAALAEWAVNQAIFQRTREKGVDLAEARDSFLQEIADNGELGVFFLESPVPQQLIKIETGSGPLEFGLRISIPEENLARLEMIVQKDIPESLENLASVILQKIARKLLNELPEEMEIQTSTVKVPDIRQLTSSPSSQR